ncbi:MAG: hypothetical protein NC420_08710 [Eubacterium sp.]|nr:hypothetical protein [Eubacterium sp.]MCM1216097.1 hypothetical protein [Lachnospiraceae bacterium]MCM1239794.1 hypothetical protein [Lachnospiraceae bacterium]MCM1410165.1 hypothetical protein [Lachnospiraceae bacterium]
MKIMLIMAGAVTGALLVMVLVAGIAAARAGRCMEAMGNLRGISNKLADI